VKQFLQISVIEAMEMSFLAFRTMMYLWFPKGSTFCMVKLQLPGLRSLECLSIQSEKVGRKHWV